MADEAPESTKKLCTFMLKISNVIRNGRVMDFDFLPIMATLTSWGVRFIFDRVAVDIPEAYGMLLSRD